MIKIRNMEENLVHDISVMEEKYFPFPWSIDSIKSELYNNNSQFFVAFIDDMPVGYIVLRTLYQEAHLINIAVDEIYRKRGIGKKLIEHFIDNYSGECRKIFLEVRTSNIAAIRFYERLGFKKLGIRKNIYEKPTEDGLIMERTINA